MEKHILKVLMFVIFSMVFTVNQYPQDFQYQDLSFKNMISKDLNFFYFYKTHLYKADFRFSDCYKTDFRCADMRYTNFRFAKLHGAKLQKANLHGADFTQADLENADLTGAKIEGIIVGEYTNLDGVKGIPKEILDKLKQTIKEKTVLAEEEERRQIEFIKSIPDRIFYYPEKIVSFLISVPKHVALKIIDRFYSKQEIVEES
ncbi:pentapeptide repeat-containing protein [Candidatus Babeliales bacterium]|nr:pentapeptide repeat-containing protein [Candidatus Babeliales bacterium]